MHAGYQKMVGAAVIAVGLATTASWGATSRGIEGSVHDFSIHTNGAGVVLSYAGAEYQVGTWNSRYGVCTPCHAAHHTDPAQIVPLWNHVTTVQTFTPYSNPDSTLDAAVGVPSGVSLACLSCHDGVTAVNALIGSSFTNAADSVDGLAIDPDAAIGTDLHTTHPISFTYNSALAALDGGLEDPSVYKIGDAKSSAKLTITTAPVPSTWSGTSLTGKTIAKAMLFNGKMECASCHDVHKMEGSSPSSGINARISGVDADGRGSTMCRTCHIK